MEEIRLRTQPQKEQEVLRLLLETAECVSKNGKPQSVYVYSNHFVPGGFSLFLFWNTATVPLQGSETAMFILEGLKPLGILDHTVLVERGKSEKARVKKKGVS